MVRLLRVVETPRVRVARGEEHEFGGSSRVVEAPRPSRRHAIGFAARVGTALESGCATPSMRAEHGLARERAAGALLAVTAHNLREFQRRKAVQRFRIGAWFRRVRELVIARSTPLRRGFRTSDHEHTSASKVVRDSKSPEYFSPPGY